MFISMEQDLKDLLEKNLEYSKAIFAQGEKIRSYIFWGKVAEAIKLVIILVPLVLAAIVLPPLVKDYLSMLGGLGK